MARRSQVHQNSAAEVAEQAMPGWKAIKETSLEESKLAAEAAGDEAPRSADAVMPSLDELRAKYLGASRADAGKALEAGVSGRNAANEAADTALVEMEAGPLRKTVAVSKSKKKVIWSQG